MHKFLISILFAGLVFVQGCTLPEETETKDVFQVLSVQDVDVPDTFISTQYPDNIAIPDVLVQAGDENVTDLLDRIGYTASLCNFTNEAQVQHFVELMQKWSELLYTDTVYGDVYIKMDNCTDTGFDIVFEAKDLLATVQVNFLAQFNNIAYNDAPNRRLAIPTLEKKKVDGIGTVKYLDRVSPDNTFDWRYAAHELGYLPSSYRSTTTVDNAILKDFFYIMYILKGNTTDELKYTAGVLLSVPKAVNCQLLLTGDTITWKVGNFSFERTTTAMSDLRKLLKLSTRVSDVRFAKLPVDSIIKIENGLPIVSNVNRVKLKDFVYKDACKKWGIESAEHVPKSVHNVFERVLYVYSLYDKYGLSNADGMVGYQKTLAGYVDSIDMHDGLYNCAAQDNSSGMPGSYYYVFSVSYKDKVYELHFVDGDIYFMLEE